MIVQGAIKLDPFSRKVFVNSNLVSLRNKEFSLMEYLLRNAGRVVSRTQILEEVWDRNIFCPTNTVDVHVSSLRRKLNGFDAKEKIRTVHSIGYMFE
ncbi:winged helix-turn-helix transcriptional regulator [Candidatus Peregrinibacteria bacterium]|jgi:two-component system, OmpR family, response regulator|nr:winged helix-turn-helix transcriptional regulator [Candidatus Peregrinibacteria bacterium]